MTLLLRQGARPTGNFGEGECILLLYVVLAHLFVEKSSVNAEVGLDAPEVMGAVQLAMIAGMPYTSIRDAIFTHPTMVQGLNGRFSKPPSKG